MYISEETVDEDLPQVWAAIIVRVNKKTDWNLNEKTEASIDAVLGKINPAKDESADSHAKAKKIWKTTLVCVDKLGIFVQRFGAIVANAASQVFGPSQQCFNAINFVIGAAQQYKEAFANITVLMERVSVFLENLSMFMDNNDSEVKLDKRLRKTVYRVLEHFVEIMATTHRLTYKKNWGERTKLMLKGIAFGEDDGIKASLATLETLVSDFTGAQISVIVQDLSAAAKSIRGVERRLDILHAAAEQLIDYSEKQDAKLDQLIDDGEKQDAKLGQLTAADDKRTAHDEEEKDLETIRKALGIDLTKNAWDRQDEMWTSRVAGTGQWLLDMNWFPIWADPKSNAPEVYTLKGPSGYGKSHLCSIVTQHLQVRPRGDSRALVAYYYFQKESSERAPPVNRAIRTIVWQLAKASRNYAKAAVKLCDGSLDSGKTAEIWKKLITDVAKSIETTVFIVLDGVEGIDKERESFVEIVRQAQNTRLFLSSTPEILDSVKEAGLPEVNLEAPLQRGDALINEQDFLLYVEDRVSHMSWHRDIDDELKQRIKNDLTRGANGEYARLNYMLDELSNIQNTNQIDDILKRANESLDQIIADRITKLNNVLSKEEIHDINVMLSWVSSSYNNMTVSQFETILSLGSEGKPIGLESRIRNKYSELFTLDDELVVDIRNGVTDYLVRLPRANGGQESLNNNGSLAIDEAELGLVRKVLRTHFRNVFGDDEVYSRFGFEDFFEKKLGDEVARIRLIPAERDVRIAQICFIVVCDRYNDIGNPALLKYAYDWVIEHIRDAIKDPGMDKIDQLAKQDIGRKLARLLTQRNLIESWWAQERMYLTDYFVAGSYSKGLLNAIHKWLKEPAVLKGLSDMPQEQEWAKQMTKGAPDYHIYSNVAKLMMQRWFDTDDKDKELWQKAFEWLRGYMTVLRDDATEAESDPPEPPGIGETALVDLVQELESWAKKELGNGDQEGKWHGRVASTLHTWGCFDAAMVRYRQAIGLRPDEWKLRANLAEVLGQSGRYEEAINTMEDLVISKQHLIGTEDEFSQLYWEHILFDIGGWNFSRKEYTAAATNYQKILDHGFEQSAFLAHVGRAVYQLLSVHVVLERFDDNVALLERLLDRIDDSDESRTSWLALLFKLSGVEVEFHKYLAATAKHSGALQAIVAKYRHALEVFRSQSLHTNEMWALWNLGALLWTLGTPDDQESALKLWEDTIYSERTDQDEYITSFRQTEAARLLAPALYRRASEMNSNAFQRLQAAEYRTRLEKLSQIQYGPYESFPRHPRLVLARMYHKDGDDRRARDILRSTLASGFSDIEDESATYPESDGFYKIAAALQALDDDDNAIAAWQQYVPKDPDESTEDGDGDSDSDSEGEGSDDGNNSDAGAGAESSSPPGPLTPNGVSPPSSNLKGPLSNTCDGTCGVSWSYPNDMFICKDCVDVQLDADCYQKLKSGQFDAAICNSEHDFIHIPPFDEKAWKSRSKDEVIVGGKVVSRDEWLHSIKRDWKIDEESLKAKEQLTNATNKIRRAWLAFRNTRTGP